MPTLITLVDSVAARASGNAFYVYPDARDLPDQPPGAYVVLYFTAGLTSSSRVGDIATDLRWSFSAVCAGYTQRSAIETTQAVRDLFTGWTPGGPETSYFTEVDIDAPLIRDESVPRDVRYSLTLTFRLTTTRS